MKIGTNDIVDCKIGSTQVNKVYLGSNLVWLKDTGTDFLTNLVAYYSFDASNATDIHTGTHNGTIIGSPTFPSGKNGNCIDFGNDDALNYFTIADNNDFSFTNGGGVDVPFTMSMWINLSAFSMTGSWFINKRPEINTQNEYQLILLGSDLQMYKFDRDNSGIFQARSYAFSPSLSTWYHIVYTDNGSKNASGMKFYINGTLVTSSDISSGVYTGMPNGNTNIFVGTDAWAQAQTLKFKGKMDELAIWKNRELTSTEVTELNNAGAGKFYNTF